MTYSVLPWHRDSRSQKRRNWRAAKRRRLAFEALENRHLLSFFLSGRVFEDLNGNGEDQNMEEPPLEGVRVDLTGTDVDQNEFTLTTYTDSNGYYELVPSLSSGIYTFTVTAPDGYLFSGGNGIWHFAGEDSPDYFDVGLYRPITIGGVVWDDMNGNGLRDDGEPGIQAATVTLSGTDGLGNSVPQSTTTDAHGAYQFNDLAPGTYAVTFTPRDDFVFTAWNVDGQGVEGVRNSDANPATGEAAPLTLVSGQIVDYVDAGLYRPPSIGDFVWNDMNGNGRQDVGEPGIPGVEVTLTGTDGLDKPVLLTRTTDHNGAYLFDNLVPGTYAVAFTAPAGYVFTAQDADFQGIKGTANSDANPATGETEALTVVSGDVATYVDAGLYVPPSIGGFVWEDTNGNGLQDGSEPGIPRVDVTLTGEDGLGTSVVLTTITDQDAIYLFENLVPGTYTVTFTAPTDHVFTAQDADGLGITGTVNSDADPDTGAAGPLALISGAVATDVDAGLYVPASIGNFVWEDLDGNGLQDAGEPGIAEVELRLSGFDGAGNEVDLSTTTDAAGLYAFAGLAPGDYTVTFVAPLGYAFTLLNADGQGVSGEDNSDADPTTGAAEPVTLVSRDVVTFVDAGLYAPRVSGTVYGDANNNGWRDAGELGIPGVYVRLLGIDDLGNQVDAWVRTDADGNFRFIYMRAGRYDLIQIHPEEFVDGQDTPGSLGGTVEPPPSDIIADIHVGPGAAGTDYLFGELRLRNPSKRHLLTPVPGSSIVGREPGTGVTEVNPVSRADHTTGLTVDRLDVNRDGFVTPADPLFVINQLNYSMAAGASHVPATQADVSGNGQVAPLDALLVINHLNQQAQQPLAEGEHEAAEGEAWQPVDDSPSTLHEDFADTRDRTDLAGWYEPGEAEDWDRWREWNAPMARDLWEMPEEEDPQDDDAWLDGLIEILASDDARVLPTFWRT
jgi:hypothetical protein